MTVMDITNLDDVRRVLRQINPSHIIHTAALSQTGECETNPDKADLVNARGVRNLVEAASTLDQPLPYFLQISTDLVFDGTQGNYREHDPPKPLQEYGRSKYAGECEATKYAGPWAIVRSALIYGMRTPEKGSFLQWMLRDIEAGTATLFTDEFRNPIWVEDLGRVLGSLAARSLEGFYHCAGGETLSRFGFGKRAAEVYGFSVTPGMGKTRVEAGLAQMRPADVSLDSSKLTSILGYQPTPLTAAIQSIKSQESRWTELW